MKVYHGTSLERLRSIRKEGIDAPSYWTNDLDLAIDYARSHTRGVVLTCDTDGLDFRANILVAQCLFDDDEIDEMPDESDLAISLELFEGIVCHERIWQFEEQHVKGDK